ncbi:MULTISPECIES: glycoside hydrolase family 3 protein [Micromonospora]|uniref:Glycoside hydrolase family 3 protein n=1 Tax=Micromonospora solifontis TaxID=2487138 RepID=A0ABX9WJS3_9ACTN|nr:MULTISPECIES: glycoside hydrolase family 3 N-terminal domain-containing protein [Micromonospora]NES14131.1 glycoside hydrolase family 3 protein [Micromonospora sp. PPF5-17B]NES35761.1 glycoside hydrolase family 3 protein [Micromonospora solifontis]NES55992.1 glycoside hydrolase family 3 protein [Micromonospora sp. PPF5-6]RNM00433.1 glycoside hydrolase family 3 protein [Micromonospora solifontis]
MGLDPGLRRLALGTLLAAYPGPVPPDWAVDLLTEGLAGHTLFGTNIHDPAQVAATTAGLRAGRPDVIVAIDEEGGDVTRLAHATGSPYPGNAALGAVDDPTLTRQVYAAIGAELAALGITVDLAPTVDVNTAAENPVIGTRSFGADPARVATHSAAAVAGLQSAGVAACAKHFPGHGATIADSHHELPTVDVPPAVLRERDLPPFAAVVDAGVRAIMTAHIRVPALTGDGPATFSRAVLVDLLRTEYGFTGTVITDALEMKGAALAAGGVGPAAVRALAAGADLLCIGSKVDAGLVERVAEEIVAAIEDGRLDRARVEEAAGRAAELATWRGAGGGAKPVPDGLGYAAALRAVRVEGDVIGLATPLVVQVHATSTIAEGRVPWGLGPHLSPGAEEVRAVAGETAPEELHRRAGDRPIVLVGRHLHRLPGARELVEGLAAMHPVTVVEMGWPSDWRPAGARAFVTTYGASHANGRAAAQVLGLTG